MSLLRQLIDADEEQRLLEERARVWKRLRKRVWYQRADWARLDRLNYYLEAAGVGGLGPTNLQPTQKEKS
jgi:hypothetical protein